MLKTLTLRALPWHILAICCGAAPAAAQRPIRFEATMGADLFGAPERGSPFGLYTAAGVRRRVGASPWETGLALVYLSRNGDIEGGKRHVGILGGRLSIGQVYRVGAVTNAHVNVGLGGYRVATRTTLDGTPAEADHGTSLGLDLAVAVQRRLAGHELGVELRNMDLVGPLFSRSKTVVVSGVLVW